MFMHAKRLTNCPKKHLELVIYLEKEIRQHNQRILKIKKGRVTAKRFKLILFRKIAFKQQQISLRPKL